VLVDFERSIFSRDDLIALKGNSVLPRGDDRNGARSLAKRIILGENKNARRFCSEMVAMLHKSSPRPQILVVGGGAIGNGIHEFYGRKDVDITGTDIYASPFTRLVADGHQLPFDDGSFDAVWIQAVLEHVLEPAIVVAEIYRVLKPDGLVYAETPFMQQVHEGAYDFTRYTVSGHRWLFRDFSLLSAGAVAGAGTASFWSIRYLARALTGSSMLGWIVAGPFFWLRFLDSITQPRPNNDAASGVYFFGLKGRASLNPRDMVSFYQSQASIKAGDHVQT
jgi:SAM-dependent methyltransferase